MQETILIVDDELKITEVLAAYLTKAGYLVEVAYDGESALKHAKSENISLMILDWMLPDISGKEVCNIIREKWKSSLPIIMLTAKVQDDDIIDGLSFGADDYVTKPFSPKVIVARVDAVLRRFRGTETDKNLIAWDDIEVNLDCRIVRKGTEEIHFTPIEYEIFTKMIQFPGRVFTREQLIECALGGLYEGYDRTIDSHIKKIRQKIEPNRSEPKYILTVHGIGYKFVKDNS